MKHGVEEIKPLVQRLLNSQIGYVIFSDDEDPYSGCILSLIERKGQMSFEMWERLPGGVDIARIYFPIDDIDKVVAEYLWRIALIVQYGSNNTLRSSGRSRSAVAKRKFNLRYMAEDIFEEVA